MHQAPTAPAAIPVTTARGAVTLASTTASTALAAASMVVSFASLTVAEDEEDCDDDAESFVKAAFAFFLFLSMPAATALFTLSTISRLCSMYSVSSKRRFDPVGASESAAFSLSLELGSMPSLRSSASSFAFCASAAACLRAGSFSRYSASLQDYESSVFKEYTKRHGHTRFRFLDRAQTPS